MESVDDGSESTTTRVVDGTDSVSRVAANITILSYINYSIPDTTLNDPETDNETNPLPQPKPRPHYPHSIPSTRLLPNLSPISPIPPPLLIDKKTPHETSFRSKKSAISNQQSANPPGPDSQTDQRSNISVVVVEHTTPKPPNAHPEGPVRPGAPSRPKAWTNGSPEAAAKLNGYNDPVSVSIRASSPLLR